ncbi:MAG: ACT domain-containing protein [Kiritimatiellae bacterium]|nr:ACT domain-containing protein [Kiritimatiellia bacterium]
MKLETIKAEFSVCKVVDYSLVDLSHPFVFTGATDEERSLVCPVAIVPANTTERCDGWRAIRVKGTLDFSLTGILARLSKVLAERGIGIFAVSTFNTDYILAKSVDFDKALDALRAAGNEISE